MRDSVKIIIACIVCLGVVGAAGMYVYFSRQKANEDRKVVNRTQNGVVQWKFEDENDQCWRDICNLEQMKGANADSPIRTTDEGILQYKDEDGEWHDIVDQKNIVGEQGKKGDTGATGRQGEKGDKGDKGDKGEKGADGRSVELRNSNGYLQWRYVGDADWKTLMATAAIAGANGKDGRSVEVRNNGVALVWRYEGESDTAWRTIVTIAALKGQEGPTGAPGAVGLPGDDGRSVEFDTSDGEIRWRYTDSEDEDWNVIAAYDELKGAPGDNGKTPQLRVDENKQLQYSYDGESWSNLYNMTLLTGPQGPQGPTGEPGAKGDKGDRVELKKFDAHDDIYDGEGTLIQAAEPAMIKYRYVDASGNPASDWMKVINLDEIKGKDGTLVDIGDLQVVDRVIGQDNTDPDNPVDITEKWIAWFKTGDTTPNYLCKLSDLSVAAPTVEPKEVFTPSADGGSVTLDSTKSYLVTMSISGENDSSTAKTASISCSNGKNVVGTWQAKIDAVYDDSDPDNIIDIPEQKFSASYSNSFVVTGESSLTFSVSNADGLSTSVTVVEI